MALSDRPLPTTLSKSRFKPRALEILREIERTGQELVLTDRGRPVVKIVPYRPQPDEARRALRGTIVRYDSPTDPVAVEDWEALG